MILKLCNNGKSVYGVLDDSTRVSYSIEAEEYKKWLLEGNTPEAEFTDVELLAQSVENQKQEAKQYLNSTDWYATRKMETGVEIPLDVLTKRAEARELINVLEAELGGN